MGVWYATRESVKAALDIKETARSNEQVDRAIEASSRAIEGQMHRRFYPWTGTRYFDWPNQQYARPWRLWLENNEMISITTLVAGGVTISSSDYFLRRADGLEEAPYSLVEIDLDSSAAFAASGTHQRAIAITGEYGHSANTAPAGALAEALDDSETGVDVTDSSLIGVGHIIKVDSERMLVTAKAMLDTGQNCTALTASTADVTITSITAGTIKVGEIILVDSERMLVVDVSGTTLTVKRAWDGSVLATHSNGADIYAPRTLTVTRGALGTTAATHLDTTPITKHVVPGLINNLCVAESLNELLQEQSGYGRTVGSGDNEREMSGGGLAVIRKQAWVEHARKLRMGAI